MGVTFLLSPLANLVLSTIGFNYTMMLATALSVTSLITSSFVNNVHLLSLTYSIMWGSGSALANHASFVTIQETYRGKLSLANGIASSGTGIGTLVVGPYLGYVLEKYHFRWAFRICAVTPLCFLLTILFSKINNQKTTAENNPVVEEKPPVVETANKEKDGFSYADNAGYIPDPSDTKDSGITPHTTHSSADNRIDENKSNSNSESNDNSSQNIYKKLFNKELWSIKSYAMFTIGVSIFLFGYFIPFVFLVSCYTFFTVAENH